METNFHTLVREELERYFITTKEVINALVHVSAKVMIGSWENVTGTVMAYLSYFPGKSPHEESVDVTIEVSLAQRECQLIADICWSSGEVIRELAHRQFSYASNEALITELKDIINEIDAEIVSYFKSL